MHKKVLSFLLLYFCVLVAFVGGPFLMSVGFADSPSDAWNRVAEQPYWIYALLSLIVSGVGAAVYKWKGSQAMITLLLILFAVIWLTWR